MGSDTDFECREVEAENKNEKVTIKVLKKHICPYDGCQSAFNRPWKLNRHINVHTKQRPFKCDFPGCTKDYMNKSHLDRHKCVSHSQNKPPPVHLPCPYPDCSKVFMNKWGLKRHCNAHKNKESYKCSECEASFKKSRQLKLHSYVHTGVKPFTCETCNDSFVTQKDFKSHKKKHKIYTCEHQDCQEQFSTWNTLRKHMKLIHFTLYTCDSCGKKFKNKWTLTEHVFIHLPDEKRDVFPCPHGDCKRYYFHQRNLEHHLKAFHQLISHKCEHENCNQTFVNKASLKKHHRLKHTNLGTAKERPTKVNLPRKPRSDKGQPRKSMAAMLSGILLPYHVDKSLAQNTITSEVLEDLQNMKNTLLKEDGFQEKEKHLSLETQLVLS